MRKLVVKISDRSGVRLQKVDFLGSSMSIGRAWNSDVILQDKFVDPDHMSLSLDQGNLLVTDLSSVNGSVVAGRQLNSDAVAYRWGDIIRVGDTRLRIFDQSAGVEPTQIQSIFFSIAEKFKSVPAVLLLTCLTLAVTLLSNWLFAGSPLSYNDYLVSAGAMLIGLTIWSLILGTFSKLVRGEGNFTALWVLACGAVILFNVISFALILLRFNLQNLQLGSFISTVVIGLFSCWTLFGVLTYTSHLAARQKWIWSILLVTAIYGFLQSDEFLMKEHERWTSSTRTEGATLPPAFLWRESRSVDEYQQDTDKLFDVDLKAR